MMPSASCCALSCRECRTLTLSCRAVEGLFSAVCVRAIYLPMPPQLCVARG